MTARHTREGLHSDRTHELLEQLVERNEQILDRVTRARDELVSTNGVMRRGAEAKEIRSGIGTNGQRLTTSAGIVAGYSLREATGALTVVRLRDGQDSNGALIAVITLAPSAGAVHWLLPGGIAFTTGLFVEVIGAGSVEGTIHVGPMGRP